MQFENERRLLLGPRAWRGPRRMFFYPLECSSRPQRAAGAQFLEGSENIFRASRSLRAGCPRSQ
jgi:hypothetical protein